MQLSPRSDWDNIAGEGNSPCTIFLMQINRIGLMVHLMWPISWHRICHKYLPSFQWEKNLTVVEETEPHAAAFSRHPSHQEMKAHPRLPCHITWASGDSRERSAAGSKTKLWLFHFLLCSSPQKMGNCSRHYSCSGRHCWIFSCSPMEGCL